jgi:hypothetical protein
LKVAFPTDEHYPYQDEKARSVALQIVEDFQPDLRICGSDGLDFYAISKFDKDPARLKAFTLQKEIDLWRAGQREWESATPSAQKLFLRANHDDRLTSYLYRHPELYELEALKLPNLLGLNSLGIDWEWDKGDRANREFVIQGKLLIKHGDIVRKHSAFTAKGELENEFNATSILSGHTHRGGSFYVMTRHGPVQAHECFCLCQLEPNYMMHPNWQQGLVLAQVSKEALQVEAILFFKKGSKTQAIWRDKEYTSK